MLCGDLRHLVYGAHKSELRLFHRGLFLVVLVCLCLVHIALFNDANPVSNQRESSRAASNRKLQTMAVDFASPFVCYVKLHF